MGYLLTGGFAKGYRTYILVGLSVAGLLANFAVGDGDLQSTVIGVFTAISALTAAKH